MKSPTMVVATLCLLLFSTGVLAGPPSEAEVTQALLGLSDCDEPDTHEDDGAHEDDDDPGDDDPCEQAMEAWGKLDETSLDSAEVRVVVERVGKAHLTHTSLTVRQTALELVVESLTVDMLMKLLRAETETDVISDLVFELGSRANTNATAYKAAMRATYAPAAPKTRRMALLGLLTGLRSHPHKAAIRQRVEAIVRTETGPNGAAACRQLYRFGASALPLMRAQLTEAEVKTTRGAMVASGCLESLVRLWATPPRIGPKGAYDLTLKVLKLKPRSLHFPRIPYTLYAPLEKTMMTAPYVKRAALVAGIVAVWTDPAVSSSTRTSGLLRLTKTLKGQPDLIKKVSKAALRMLEGAYNGKAYDAVRLINARASLGWGPKQLKALQKVYKKRVGSPKDTKLQKRDTRILKGLDEALAAIAK